MKHKTGVPISKLRNLTGEGGKPMSQVAFAKFIGMPSGTLARVEAGAVELPRSAADRIEAACGVDADKLYDGELRALDGTPYTAQTWQRRQRLELSDLEMTGLYEEMTLRIRLLLGALGRRRAVYGGTRLRQLFEDIRDESGLAPAEIEMAARSYAQVDVKDMTVATLAQQEDVPTDVLAKLKKLPPRKKCRVTVEKYMTWPPYRVESVANVFAYAIRTLWRADLPDGSREDWAITVKGGRGRASKSTTDVGLWSTTPGIEAVAQAIVRQGTRPGAD